MRTGHYHRLPLSLKQVTGAPYLVLLRDVGGGHWPPFSRIKSFSAETSGMMLVPWGKPELVKPASSLGFKGATNGRPPHLVTTRDMGHPSFVSNRKGTGAKAARLKSCLDTKPVRLRRLRSKVAGDGYDVLDAQLSDYAFHHRRHRTVAVT